MTLTHPFNCFLLLAGLNSLLAYTPLAWPLKLVIGILGFGTLGWFYVFKRPPSPDGEVPFYTNELFTPVPWLAALGLVLALAVRFYKLSSYLSFPIPDEVINAYNAIHSNDPWSSNAFYYTSQMPPFYIWLLAWVFKIGGVSNLSLWLVPALLSFLSVIFYYLAFRELFSRSLSLVCLFLLGVGFWPVLLGRFSHNAVLMVFWEALALWILAKFSKAGPARNRAGLAIALGLCLGLGFYTYFGWLLVALWFLPAIWKICARSGPKGKNLFVLGLAAAILSALPLAVAALRESFGPYLKDLVLTGRLADNMFQWNFQKNLYYITSLLWTGFNGQFAYNPQWGGFLNPILGSLFLLGAAEGFRLRHLPLVKWMAFGFAVLLVPCLVTHSANWYHVAALMPLFIGVAAWGFSVLWAGFPRGSTRISLALGLFFLSFLLDWANLEKTMGVADREYSASNPTVSVCQSLRELGQTRGPGLVFSNFCLDRTNPLFTQVTDASSGKTTTFFTSHWLPCYTALGAYSLNVLVNPALAPTQTTWAAITTDDWAKSLLSQWFPDATFSSKENHSPSDNSLLAVIPLTSQNRKILDGWREADRILRESDFLEFNHPYSQPYDAIIRLLRDREFLFRDNPFLRFYYWGKLSNLYCVNNQFDLALPAFQKALQDGATGLLCYNLANVLGLAGRYLEEKQAYLQAAKWDSRFQPSPEDLKALDAMIAKTANASTSPGIGGLK